ncbi:MAG: glycosyltransferase [Clostridia bacterium]|nr:glycosyltransferase [Clostridia bacterium]
MNIVFASNYYNHHQSSISQELNRLTNGEFSFITTMSVPAQRRALGYTEMTESFVYHCENQEETFTKAVQLVDDADVVIVGGTLEQLLKNRKKAGKLIFRCSERLLKNGFEPLKYPWRFYKWHKNMPSKANVYMLCASAYTASDYAAFGMYRKKTYKWGYFPETKYYENSKGLIDQKDTTQILWCGRFLDWKHPDDVLTVAKRLKDQNYNFHINIIGAGEMENTLKQFVLENDLSEQVSLLGSMSPEKVREHMEKSGIFLFTSDRKEGWGAVLNEAMNSACAVIASTEAGSTPYLIRQGENGLTYSSCKVDELLENVKYLLKHPEEQARLGQAAYETITTEWNADIAAERLVALATRILNGEKYPDLYSEGPCSRA